MTKNIKGILAGIGLIVLVFAVVGNISPAKADTPNTAVSLNLSFEQIKELIGMFQGVNFGASSGPAHWQTESFLQGLAAGGRDQFSISNVGALTSSGAMTLSGAITSSGALTQSGATTISGALTQSGVATFSGDYNLMGTTTQSGLSMFTIEATSTVAIPLTLRGYTSQVANLFQIHNVGGTELFAIDNNGNASTSVITTSGDLYVNGYATTTASNGNFATRGTLTVGSSGTAQTSQITTTCSPIADVSIAATSTGYAYCTGVTGITSSYNVVAQFATSTPAGDGWVQETDNFWIVSAKASTTAGAIDFQVYNGTGATKAPSASGARTASTTAIHASY